MHPMLKGARRRQMAYRNRGLAQPLRRTSLRTGLGENQAGRAPEASERAYLLFALAIAGIFIAISAASW